MRGATINDETMKYSVLFQSTLLMRGATTQTVTLTDKLSSHFNPRSSCEERRITTLDDMQADIFQSTLLMRGATGGSTATSA